MDKLAMTLLVRNEEDIIESNIRFHAKLGVDVFVVMNNGSTDSTVDILRELRKEFPIQLFHQPVHNYQQRQWMFRLACEAKNRMGARWVISNDADEFWVPKNLSNQNKIFDIKKLLHKYDSVVTVKRINCLLDQDCLTLEKFSQAPYYVNKTIQYTKNQELHDDTISMALANISPKVIVNPFGLIKISAGNHRAKHWISWLTAREESQLIVRHYPFRSWQQFKLNVERRVKLLQNHPQTRMGEHYHRWVRQYKQGLLEEEFEKLYVSSKNTHDWLAKGYIKKFDNEKNLSLLF